MGVKNDRTVLNYRINAIAEYFNKPIRLHDRGSDYPYRYSIVIDDLENIGCYSYFMGGTGSYFDFQGICNYVNGLYEMRIFMLNEMVKGK